MARVNSVEKKIYQVGICGPENVVKCLTKYMGLERFSPKGIQYFEFPNNPKFDNEVFRKKFNHNSSVYIAQQGILNTIYFPKELKMLDLILLVYDISEFNSFNVCYEYLKKIATNTKYFPPYILIGYSRQGSPRTDNGTNSFKQLMLHDEIKSILKTECPTIEIEEDKNEALSVAKLKIILDKIDPAKIYREEHIIIVENKLKELRESYLKILAADLAAEDKLKIAYKLEERKKVALTKSFLIENYGWNEKIAIDFINMWESRLSEEDKKVIDELIQKSEKGVEGSDETATVDTKFIRTCENALERIATLRSEVSLNSLLQLGYDLQLSKKILYYLNKINKIQNLSLHRESIDYENFKNIFYFIVLYKHQHFYSKSLDEDKCLLFSGLIQSIESIKDNFLKESNEYCAPAERFIIEFLQFGEKFLVLVGNSRDELKVIIRFRKKPADVSYWEKKVKYFMMDYINEVPLESQTKGAEYYTTVRKTSEKIFYRHFNPFQIKLDNLLPIKILKAESNLEEFTQREQIVIKYLQSNQSDPNKLLIENVIGGVAEQYKYEISRSDIVIILSELIKQKLVGQ